MRPVSVRALASTALLLAPASLTAQGAVPLTIENIQTRSAGASAVTISPDGAWLLVSGSDGSGRGFRLMRTDGTSRGDWIAGGAPSWFPDSRRYAFLASGDLWVGSIDGGEAVRLTDDRDDERGPVVSPDGRAIAFYSTRSGAQDIWMVPAGGGAPRQLTRQAMSVDDPRFVPAWSPDGRSIAFVSNRSDYWSDDLWVVDVATGSSRQLSRGLMASTTPAWSPDGRWIVLMGTSKRGYWYEDLADLYRVEVATGAERTVPMQVYATDWLHSQSVHVSPDGGSILFPYLERGAFDLWSVPADGGVASRVSNLGGVIGSIDVSADGSSIVFVRSTETTGREVYLLDGRGGSARQLTTLADRWEGVAAPEEISFRSHGGLYLQGFLFKPPAMEAGRTYPALVQVHGGGTNSYLRGLNLLEQYLAGQGYVVLAINYRGGSGFGREFQDLSINDWANGQALDAAEAARFRRTQSWSNGKVGIYGYSYGGIQTMAAIARAPGVFDAAVPMAGIYDFADAYTNADRLGRIFIKTGHGGAPDERPGVYAVSNTLARLRQVTTPLLVMHGEADVRAPYRQFQLAVDSLRAFGKVFESKSFPGEPHGFRDPAHRIELYRRLEAFFARYLQPTG
ncbi:MAG: prolyl oligopeptidase family serine peptidase [Gemmatimonadales bacterium]